MAKGTHDRDGFMTLVPCRMNRNIGNCKLIKEDKHDAYKTGKSAHSTGFCIRGSDSELRYVTGYKPKAWQHKAWSLIGRGISWRSSPPMAASSKVSHQFRHTIRLAVSLKLCGNMHKSNGPAGGKSTLWQLADGGEYGSYRVADTKGDMIELLEDVYDAMFNHIDDIITAIDKRGYREAVFTTKCMIIYDDKTYDTITGDPRNLFELLGVNFSKKGRVKL